MKADRFFYSIAGAIMLTLMLIGFRAFYVHGTGQDGRIIDPTIYPLVTIHGLAIATWFVLFFVQSLLISVRNRRLHMRLGWSSVAIGLTIACTGTLVAIRSVQVTPPILFFGMEYRRFLLVMLTEIVFFTAFLTVGILSRRKPKLHRPMMLLAGLSIVAGATVRIPALYPLFGKAGWVAMFGPVFCLGAILLAIRFALTRSFDWWFSVGYGVWVLAYIAVANFAVSGAGGRLASAILKL
jgi:hypothetical protein